jgi:hypothetical protein
VSLLGELGEFRGKNVPPPKIRTIKINLKKPIKKPITF